jgi:CheY-like chemotaxis protein
MESANSHRFDLRALLKLGCLDVQMTARINPALSLDEYCYSLWQFTNHMSNILSAVNRIAAIESSEFDLQYMTFVKNMLKGIGCYKFMPEINDIVQSGKMGHNEYAASLAKKLSKDLNDFFTRMKKAENKQDTQTASDISDEVSDTDSQTGGSPPPSSEKISLSKALALLEQEESSRKMKILAIDDSPVMLQTISSLLGGDYTVYKMINPTMLEKFLEQVTPELFLLDYKMPELSGFDLIPVIRNFEEHKNTPIVFLTSEGTTDHVSSALSLGARDFIIKPFQPDTLREKVAKPIVRKSLLEKRAA